MVRNADELHEALTQMGLLPAREGLDWREYFGELAASGRAIEARSPDGDTIWVATEMVPMARAARPDLLIEPSPVIPDGIRTDWEASDARVALVRGRMEVVGPATVAALSKTLGLGESQVEAGLAALEGQGLVLRGRFTPNAPSTEYCSRHLLSRIHRLTMDRLRRQIRPATVEDYLMFLLRWHHLEPGTQAGGIDALASVIDRLQGFEIPAAAWEQIILPLRLSKYDPKWLDDLCLNGEVSWGRIEPPRTGGEENGSRVRAANRLLPVSLMFREDLSWLRRDTQKNLDLFLSHPAKAVLEELKKNGASFFSDLLSATRLLPTQLEEALWELVAAGLVTGDGFAGLRSLVNPLRKQQEAKIRRLRSRGRAVHATRRGAGRWTLFPFSSDAVPREEIVENWARQLLHRYGVLFRDLLAREDCAPPWWEMRPVLRRLEARGEIYGGRFVAGVSGEQYALSEAVEMLRHIRKNPPEPQPVYVSGVDPLNLVGIITPGGRLPAQMGNTVAYYNGAVAGTSRAGEVGVDGKIEGGVAEKIRRVLSSGRLIQTGPQ